MLTIEEYENKRQARYDRLLAAAKKAELESAASIDNAHKMASCIPMGQPILVGHHSEKSDRNYRARIHNKFGRGFKLAQKAEEYRSRAASIDKNNSIFSDDPQAIEKIGGKLAQLEARQERMKAANKLVKKNDRAGLLDMGYTETQITRLFTPDFCGRIGYPDFEITNNGSNIRRLKKRAEVVEKRQNTADFEETINGVKIEYCPSENRIRVYFPTERVSRDVFMELKHGGFRATRDGFFSAYYNGNAQYCARQIANKYEVAK